MKWRPILDQWRHSGLTAAAFCRQRGIPASALLHWKKQILLRDQRRQAERAASEASRNALKFLPVQVLEPAAAETGSLEIVLRNGRVLRIGGDFEPVILRKLVATLEETL